MRTVDLGRTAAQAELVRIKRMIHRQVMRVVWGAVAAVFGIAVLVVLHFIAYLALVPALLSPLLGAVAVFVFDLIVAAIFGLLAMRGAPDAVEAEAKQLRDRSLAGMRDSLAISTLLNPISRAVFRSAGPRSLWGATFAALTANFLSNNRR